MNHIKRFTSLLISVILIFTLTACDSTDKAYIYFNLSEQPTTLDPQTAKSDCELVIIRNIFEGLLRKDKDGKIVNGLAKEYKKSGLTYTFKLNPKATWSDETPITAYDFQFAFRRAVNPETKAPFARRLLCIKNAESILNGKKDILTLGVKAIDTHTLKITLEKEDENFLENLTTSIAMPCNESFFNQSAGKYGLEKECILSNGSYRLAKWNKEIFGIRLYRNDFYKGEFTAKNAAVFFSTDKERSSVQVLADGDAEVAFITPEELEIAKEANLKTSEYENICWFLTISDGFSKGIRKSLITLAHPQVFSKNLKDGYSQAHSIFPSALSTSATATGMPIYDLENAKKLFRTEIENLVDKKFPTDVVLYYYDNGFSKTIVTDIVGHWQNQLGAFVNIKSVSAPEILQSQLIDQTFALSVFPISASSTDISEYLENFGIKYNGKSLTSIQKKVLKSNNIVPLMTQKTIVAYSDELSNLNFNLQSGGIDFAYVVKKSK